MPGLVLKSGLVTQAMTLKDIYPDLASQISKDFGLEEGSIPFIRKGLTPSDMKFEEGERASIDYITTTSKDRDCEVVDPSGAILGDYLKHPVVLFGHNYKGLPIGRCAWMKKDDKGIIAKTIYAMHDEAEKVYQYRKSGFPMAKSIGFVPIEWKDFNSAEMSKNGGIKRTFTKWLMLEYSDVSVPSNPDALQIAMSKGLDLSDDFAKTADLDIPQVIVEEKMEPKTVWKCPYCMNEIGEKELYYDGTFWYHRPCKDAGPIRIKGDDAPQVLKFVEGEQTSNPNPAKPPAQAKPEFAEQIKAVLKELGIEPVVEKRADLKGNASVADIVEAFYNNIDNQDKENGTYTYGWLTDMYPVKYPSGNAAFAIYKSGKTKHYMYEYSYTDGECTMNTITEIVSTYKPKGVDTSRKELMMKAALEAESKEGVVELEEEEVVVDIIEVKEPDIVIDMNEELEIDEKDVGDLASIIAKSLGNLFSTKVDEATKRMTGKVI
jgi:hypothetical protein